MHLTDEHLRKAYLDRQVLQVLAPSVAMLPLWDDPETGRPVVLAWDRDALWVGAAADVTGRELEPFTEPIRLTAMVSGTAYTLGVVRSLALLLAARWELTCTVRYRSVKPGKPDRVTERELRVLSIAKERYVYGAAISSLAETPRGEPVPKGSLRSFKLGGFESVKISDAVPFEWAEGEGYRLVEHTYAATVADREGSLANGTTRQSAIETAADALLEASDWELEAYTVVVYTDPVWCEKAPQFCDEHDHSEWPRWLEGWALEECVEIEVYLVDPEDEDSDPAWRLASGGDS